MTDDENFPLLLDVKVLENLAALICGDEFFYRRGFEIEKFFRACGWYTVDEFEGYRREWALDRLREREHDPEAMRAVVLRLADPREYLDDPDAQPAVLAELNRLLAVEGYQIVFSGNRPVLSEYGPNTGDRGLAGAPVELTASLADVVSDPAFGQQLRSRLDEAYVCWQSGAPTAAIIMLGSLLEGVLYDVALSRYESGPRPVDKLEDLISRARDAQWIGAEVAEYADVLRNHRNLVHPKRQWLNSYDPADDVVRIAWNVVVAAINDLAVLPECAAADS